MAQFDVHRNPRGGDYPLLIDVQSDLLQRLATRVVVPLITAKRYGGRPITRLNPTAKIRAVEYVLVFQELAAIPASALGESVTSLADRRVELVAALDLLFTGV
jgi:toxin CcdB